MAAQILHESILDTIMETKEKVVDNNMRLELSFRKTMFIYPYRP